MADPVITNNDLGSVVISDDVYEDGLLTFSAAGTVSAGTLIARDTSTNNFVPFVTGGTTNGNGTVSAIVTRDVVATASGDVPFRPLMEGHVRFDKLIIAADADNSNIDGGVIDQLRARGILARMSEELYIQDNQ